jgi:hypothetical protein
MTTNKENDPEPVRILLRCLTLSLAISAVPCADTGYSFPHCTAILISGPGIHARINRSVAMPAGVPSGTRKSTR